MTGSGAQGSEPPVAPPVSAHADAKEALLELIIRQARRLPLTMFTCDALLAWAASLHVSGVKPWAWLAIATIASAIRWRIWGWLRSAMHLTPTIRIRISLAIYASNGILHAAIAVIAFGMPGIERAILTICLMCMCVSSVATSAGYPPAVLAFSVPVIVALAVDWIVYPVAHESVSIQVATGVLILGYCMIVMALAKDMSRLFQESFAIRQELVEITQKLRKALGEAQSANRAKTRFLASASHDLRQPMHTLSLFGAALSLRNLDPESARIAGYLNTSLATLGNQLDALLDVSKLDAGLVKPAQSDTPIAALLGQVHAEFEPLAERKGLRLEIDCPPDARLFVDPILLSRVLRNLVDNAIKYSEHGSIRLEAHDLGPSWRIQVTDQGIGIDPHEREAIFEEFYQIGNPERDRTKGLGLGLSIVKRLADLIEAQVTIDSQPRQGTRVSVILAKREPLPAEAPPTDAAYILPSLKGIRILVIDDEEAIRIGMHTLLGSMGCIVDIAGDEDAALELAMQRRPDIVLADLRLRNGRDGIAAIERIRSLHAAIPALLISGDTAPDWLRRAESAGIAMLHKPIAVPLLCRVLAQHLAVAGRSIH